MSEYKLRGLPKQISNLAQIYQLISFIDSAISEKRSVEAAHKAGIKAKITKIKTRTNLMRIHLNNRESAAVNICIKSWAGNA